MPLRQFTPVKITTPPLNVHIYAAAQAYTIQIGCGPKTSCDSLVNIAKSGCEHSWAGVQVEDSFHECRRYKTVKYLEMRVYKMKEFLFDDMTA